MARRSLLAVADALLPGADHEVLLRSLLEAGFPAFVDELRREAPPAFRLAMALAFFAGVWVSPLLIGRLPPLQRCDPEARERALDAMANSRFPLLRQLVQVLKHVTALCYGADPVVRRAIGYGPERSGRLP